MIVARVVAEEQFAIMARLRAFLIIAHAPPPPSAHLQLILPEHKIIPATKESYWVYVGTTTQNSSIDLV